MFSFSKTQGGITINDAQFINCDLDVLKHLGITQSKTEANIILTNELFSINILNKRCLS